MSLASYHESNRRNRAKLCVVITPGHRQELEALEAKYRDQSTGNIVFYGSSSVRLWFGLGRAFPDAKIENWGFGGSTLRECADGFERFIVPRRPRALLLYAGVNDVGQGATPEAVWEALRDLMDARDARLGALSTAFLAIKLPPARLDKREITEQANLWCQREIWAHPNAQWVDAATPLLDAKENPRPEMFMEDGLHLSRAGYEVWNEMLKRELSWLGHNSF